jgi:hypothetical protein
MQAPSPAGELPADARQRRLWMAVRQALLMLVGAIEHEYGLGKKDRV